MIPTDSTPKTQAVGARHELGMNRLGLGQPDALS